MGTLPLFVVELSLVQVWAPYLPGGTGHCGGAELITGAGVSPVCDGGELRTGAGISPPFVVETLVFVWAPCLFYGGSELSTGAGTSPLFTMELILVQVRAPHLCLRRS